jgi:hypothetical protein
MGKPRKKSSWRGRLFFWVILFGFGFYAGVQATKRVSANGPTWLQTVFGVSVATATPAQNAGLPANPPPTASNPASGQLTAPPVNQGAPAPPINQAPNPAAQNPNVPAPGFPGVRSNPDKPNVEVPTPAQPAPNPGTASTPASVLSGNLEAQVADYNSALRRIQETYRAYMNAVQKTMRQDLKAEEIQAALDLKNTTTDELVSGVQRAQLLYDSIHSNPEFTVKYVEKESALSSSQLPQSLPELSVDHLKFIRKK